MKKTILFVLITISTFTYGQLSISGSVTQPLCESCSGEINVTANGGISPYEYRLYDVANDDYLDWQINGQFNNLVQGVYRIQIKDATGVDPTYGVDIPIEYEPEVAVPTGYEGQIIDTITHIGVEYPIVKIGNQLWTGKNVNTSVQCYDDLVNNCNEYGSLYTWTEAKEMCPEGYRLPSNTDWTQLVNNYGSSAADSLYNGAFQSQLGGYGNGNGWYAHKDIIGVCWESIGISGKGYRRQMGTTGGVSRGLSQASDMYSVRCVKDAKPATRSFMGIMPPVNNNTPEPLPGEVSITGFIQQPLTAGGNGVISITTVLGGVPPYEYRLMDAVTGQWVQFNYYSPSGWQTGNTFHVTDGVYIIQLKDSRETFPTYGQAKIIQYSSSTAGEQQAFSGIIKQGTPNEIIINDSRDNKTYIAVRLGSLYWMQDNLKRVVPNLTIPVDSTMLADGIYYSYQEKNIGVCPDGWRLPTRNDYLDLAQQIPANVIELDEHNNRTVRDWIVDTLDIQYSGYMTKRSSGSNVYYENVFGYFVHPANGMEFGYGAFWVNEEDLGKGYTMRVSAGSAANQTGFMLYPQSLYQVENSFYNYFNIRCVKDIEPVVIDNLYLSQGYNYIEFQSLNITDVEQLFAPYSNTIIEIVDMETYSNGIYLPTFGVNQIGNILTKNMYKIRSNDVIIIPLN